MRRKRTPAELGENVARKEPRQCRKDNILIQEGLHNLARCIWNGHGSQDWEGVIYEISSYVAAFCGYPDQRKYEEAVREELIQRVKKLDST